MKINLKKNLSFILYSICVHLWLKFQINSPLKICVNQRNLIDHAPNWLALQKSDKALFDKLVPDSIHPSAEGNTLIVTPLILKSIGLN